MGTSKERAYLLITTCFRSLVEAAALIDHDPGIIHERTGLGETALHYLAVENELEAVRFLHERGSDINTVNDYNETPMYQVVSLGYVDLARYLLENSASINLHMAESQYNDPIIKHAVPSGNPAMIALLVEYGADINERCLMDETPLHEAATDDKCLEATRYLVGNGADIDAFDAFHATPLIKAAMFGSIETAKFLVRSGASLVEKDERGRTAAKMASRHRFHELADWLEQSADIQGGTHRGI